MERRYCPPRAGWREQVMSDGLVYLDSTAPSGAVVTYWTETSYYLFTLAEIEELRRACNELTHMFVAAGDHIIKNNLFSKMAIPAHAIQAIKRTWEDHDPEMHWPSLIGRFDIRWGGHNFPGAADDPTLLVPKLFENNADTPTSFPESTGVQWNWHLFSQALGTDQWNNAYEALVQAFQRNIPLLERRSGRKVTTIHFAYTTAETSGEDQMNTTLIAAAAQAAGYKVKVMAMEDIKLVAQNGVEVSIAGMTTFTEAGCFIDSDGLPIDVIFKLYPWEWMFQEAFGKTALWSIVQPDGTIWIEPPYKAMWSNKGILAVLWELYKDDPDRSKYLLPTYFMGEEPSGFRRNCVRKPLLGREGANITVVRDGKRIESHGGQYGEEGYVLQQFAPLPAFEGVGGPFHPVLGVWMIDQEAEGLGIRESTDLVTNNMSQFVPHKIV
jgi:glutathionylspermidine synthase